jgi:hypothetical protein
MILLVALCVAMSMSAQGAARTKPATATQCTTATPPRTNAAAMRANAELFHTRFLHLCNIFLCK